MLETRAPSRTTQPPPEQRLRDPIIAKFEQQVRRGRRRRHAAVVSSRIAILVAFFGAWQLVGGSSDYWRFVISTPAATAETLWGWLVDPAFWTNDVWTTVQEAGLGYLIGIAVGVTLVVLVIAIPGGFDFLSPFLAAANALPKIVLAPLFIIWFGLSMIGKVVFVAAAIFFIVFYGLHSGLRSIDQNLVDNARMLGGSTFQLVPTLYVPAVMTWLVVSLRLSATFSLLAAVVAEYIGARAGLGHLIAAGRSALDASEVLAGVFFLGVMALVFDRLLLRVQRRYEQRTVF